MVKRPGKKDTAKESGSSAEDNSHYGKAFRIASEREKVRDDLSKAKSSWTRKRLSKEIREKDAKLDALAERDRAMTRLLAEYQRRRDPYLEPKGEIKKWLRGERDDLGTYAQSPEGAPCVITAPSA